MTQVKTISNIDNNKPLSIKSQVKNSPQSLSLFKPFKPTREKILLLAKKLMEEKYYLEDSYRDYSTIHKILFNGFSNKDNEFWEIGEFDGILGFVSVEENHKAGIVFKLWNKGIWEKEIWEEVFKREIKRLIKSTIEKHNLLRLEMESPDRKILKLSKLWGGKIEGKFRYFFRWNNKFYTVYRMRILREEIESSGKNSNSTKQTIKIQR